MARHGYSWHILEETQWGRHVRWQPVRTPNSPFFWATRGDASQALLGAIDLRPSSLFNVYQWDAGSKRWRLER